MSIRPFEGLKVLDLAWVVAGPLIGRTLADYGATVVRVESAKRVDTARLMGPFPNGGMDRNRSALFDNCNAGKLGLSLDLATQEGQQVARDLSCWADVLIESFSPGQMRRWGLGYETLGALNRRLIMLSTSLMGQNGPYSRFAGFGNLGAAVAGFQQLVGLPGEAPVGPFGPYTDYIGPRFGLVALLAALDERRRSGLGCYLDVAQVEAGLSLLAPQLADYTLNGRLPEAQGNRDAQMAPHGVFPCLPAAVEGEAADTWVAIAVPDDSAWQRLAAMVDANGLAGNPRFDSLAGRKAHEDFLEQALGAWTRTQTAAAIEARLLAADIPAHRLMSSADLVADPQLIAQGHFRSLPHPLGGLSWFEASRHALSDSNAAPEVCAPTPGRDSARVLREFAGCDGERIEHLRAAGALT